VIFIQLFLLGLSGQGFRLWTHRSKAQCLNIALNTAAFADWQLLASNGHAKRETFGGGSECNNAVE